ncbi:Membrane protein of ER body 1 [Camellia lanceoleosa]|uniref:Membrane protein of ER body 1 n=1 Tax=Camellia lanceoleosa TaxID=1840588 RepID=A0ACC0F1R5_9ERIC|nr:Membrane protein of ER body 1 [Camellia lanceoleosa]
MKAEMVKILEVVKEVCLQWRQRRRRRRRPRHQTITAANGNGNSNSTDEHDKEEGKGSVPENMEEIGGTEPTEIRSSETYYTTVDSSLSKANGSTREEEELDVKLKKIEIQKILRSVITHQDEETVKNEISCEEEYMLFKLLSEGTKEPVNINRLDHKESDEEIEFEFERVVEKLDQHSVHCPKCNSCITKVVLRKKVRTSTVPPKPFDLLKCFSCFSIFIPKGIFRRQNGITNKQSLHETSSVLDENLSSILTDDPKGKMVKIDQQQGRSFDIFRASTSKQNPQPTSAIAGNYSTCVIHETASVVIGQEETKTPSQESVSPGKAVCETAPSTNRVVPPGGLGDLAINIEEGSGSREQQPVITLDEEGSKTLEILKSVVYGGLMESMTSLSVVSSAAAADATTMNIVAMGLANLIGGLCIIGPNLRELKNEESRYKELLGQTDNFLLHATVAVLVFLIFGLIPPVTHGFSFRQIDDKDLKLVLVAAASLPCIVRLAIGKAYIQKKPNFYTYIKTILYYIGMAVMASGISYAAGELIKRLVEKLGWFDSSVAVTLSLPQVQSVNPAWRSY